MVLKRGVITVINIIFPPVGVALLCGVDVDLFINCMLFLCAVIPSHVHAFYLSCTYFSRKRKVRKGIYPGDWRPMIYTERVQNGGASRREVEELRQEMLFEKAGKNLSRSSTRGSKKSSRSRRVGHGIPTSPQSVYSPYASPASPQSQNTSRMSRTSTGYTTHAHPEMRAQGIPSEVGYPGPRASRIVY